MLFTPDGGTLLSGTSDFLKVWKWAQSALGAAVDVSWTKLADLSMHEGKLLGASVQNSFVGVWVVDLNRVELFHSGAERGPGGGGDARGERRARSPRQRRRRSRIRRVAAAAEAASRARGTPNPPPRWIRMGTPWTRTVAAARARRRAGLDANKMARGEERRRAAVAPNQGRHERQLRGGARHRRRPTREGEPSRGVRQTPTPTCGRDGSYPTRARRTVGARDTGRPRGPSSSSSVAEELDDDVSLPGSDAGSKDSLEAEGARDELGRRFVDGSFASPAAARVVARPRVSPRSPRQTTATSRRSDPPRSRRTRGSSTSPKRTRARARTRRSRRPWRARGWNARARRTEASAAPSRIESRRIRVTTPVRSPRSGSSGSGSSGFESERESGSGSDGRRDDRARARPRRDDATDAPGAADTPDAPPDASGTPSFRDPSASDAGDLVERRDGFGLFFVSPRRARRAARVAATPRGRVRGSRASERVGSRGGGGRFRRATVTLARRARSVDRRRRSRRGGGVDSRGDDSAVVDVCRGALESRTATNPGGDALTLELAAALVPRGAAAPPPHVAHADAALRFSRLVAGAFGDAMRGAASPTGRLGVDLAGEESGARGDGAEGAVGGERRVGGNRRGGGRVGAAREGTLGGAGRAVSEGDDEGHALDGDGSYAPETRFRHPYPSRARRDDGRVPVREREYG